MRDFTLQSYEALLDALLAAGYRFETFGDRCAERPLTLKDRCTEGQKIIILRHDVDKKPENSLATARLEAKKGIRASYYFRVVPESNDAEVIREIVRLGHEIGYHYEDMSICHGDVVKAKAHFDQWLAYFRTFYPVRTICMHGAPTSKWDGRKLWETYDYKKEGIIGEPYYDVDFSQTFYLTDTGRCWDGYKVSVRDKIPQYQDQWTAQGLVYHHTWDVIRAIQEGRFPQQVMMTTHPQRWTDKPVAWVKEMIMQTLKNTIKRIYVAKNTK
ncbi:MAG: hypothetical protein MJZ58_02250 [Paludibacteraceae bacterium]|nr:hypothetical protein [Paludibacteraceae bacterium]